MDRDQHSFLAIQIQKISAATKTMPRRKVAALIAK
jgi:hypothetical protein